MAEDAPLWWIATALPLGILIGLAVAQALIAIVKHHRQRRRPLEEEPVRRRHARPVRARDGDDGDDARLHGRGHEARGASWRSEGAGIAEALRNVPETDAEAQASFTGAQLRSK
jgi:hypothetical protein